jgi:hypothetical protein
LTEIFALLCCAALWQGTAQAPGQKPKARYVNCDFGYVVQVPPELTGGVSAYSRHGFRIQLPDGKSVIEIYNAFNMGESTSFTDIVKYELELRSQGRENWEIVSRRVGQMKGFDSEQVTARYTRKTEVWKARAFVVYRPSQTDGLGNITYVLELSSPEASYENALAKFNQTVDGFQLIDLPHGPCSNN